MQWSHMRSWRNCWRRDYQFSHKLEYATLLLALAERQMSNIMSVAYVRAQRTSPDICRMAKLKKRLT